MPVLVTTSRRPTRRSRRLAKELCRVVPYFRKINRGSMGYRDLREYMIKKGFSRLIIIENYRGNPGVLEFLVLDELFLRRIGKLIINSLSLQVDVKKEYVFNSLKKVVFKNVEEPVMEVLKLYFYSFYGSGEGEAGTLIIKKNDNLSFNFYDHKGKKVLPYIDGRFVIYERQTNV